jgi:hypothetical protein
MAITLSAKAQLLLEKRNVQNQIILEIDGVNELFGSIEVLELADYGDEGLVYGMEGVVYGGAYTSINSRPYISLSGSSNTISQQLNPDKGSAQSVTSMQIELIDFNGEITELITPDIVLPEILGVKARVYLNFEGGAHPEDSILIHRGIITDVESAPASVKFSISNPEKQKQQQIFVKQSTTLTQDLKFNSKIVADIYFKQKTDVTGTVTVNVIDTGVTAGNEIVTVLGTAITIDIEDGVSTANQIKAKLIESAQAMDLVSIQVLSGQGGVAQNITGSAQSMETDLVVNVVSTEGFITGDGDGRLRTYVQINDEIIEYTGLTSTTLTGCTRAQLNTIGATHSTDDDVDTFYRLQGNCIDLALWVMMGKSVQPYQENFAVKAYTQVEPTTNIVGAIMFDYFDVQEKFGLVVGDMITTTGSVNPSNNVTQEPIIGFGKNDFGSYVLTNITTVLEPVSTAVASFSSKYYVLDEGLGMSPDDVDVARHEEIKERHFSDLPDLDIYIKDTITDAKSWLAEEIYLPAGLYTLPRKARSSVNKITPPIADQKIFTLDDTTLTEASKIKPVRSISKNFYNAVVFKYEQDSLEEKYLRAKVNYSTESQARIKNVGNKVLTIESAGLRDVPATETIIRTNSRRILERYQFAAEFIPQLKPLYKEALTIEVGDVVIFGSPELKVSDVTTGTRQFEPRLYEAQNKSLNFKTGAITIDLLSTNFEVDGRYGIISPNSYVDTGSSTTNIFITRSFNTGATEKEKDKWSPYIGQTIRVRNTDFTFDEETTLIGFDPTNDAVMIVSPALSSAPTAGMLIDTPEYDLGNDNTVNSYWKLLHCFFDPNVLVTVGNSATSFDVSGGDIGKFIEGAIVRVHSADYTVDSVETFVSNITGNTITVNDSLGFTPSAGYEVDLIGFLDGGLPYRYV